MNSIQILFFGYLYKKNLLNASLNGTVSNKIVYISVNNNMNQRLFCKLQKGIRLPHAILYYFRDFFGF